MTAVVISVPLLALGALLLWLVEHHTHIAVITAVAVLLGPGYVLARTVRMRARWLGQGCGKRIAPPRPKAITAAPEQAS